MNNGERINFQGYGYACIVLFYIFCIIEMLILFPELSQKKEQTKEVVLNFNYLLQNVSVFSIIERNFLLQKTKSIQSIYLYKFTWETH